MRPDWNKAPDWALFVAQEASGSWYWYAERPIYSELCTEWQAKGQRQIIPRVDLRPQETLEERPRPQPDAIVSNKRIKSIDLRSGHVVFQE